MIKITIIFVTLFLFTIAACDECENCTDPEYISGYTELESISCEDLSFCAQIVYLPEDECKANDYPENCHECVINADSCGEVNQCYKDKCHGKEDSFNNENTSNNTTPVITTSEDDLCNIIRIDCGHDTNDHQYCLKNIMVELGAFGQECVDKTVDEDKKTVDCLAVAECLSTYTKK